NKDAYGYARTVLMNHVIDGWRRPYRENPTDELPERPVGDDVEHLVTQREWLTAVLATLTDRERAVVVLRHFFDLPEADVAAELGVSLGTVKSTNSRALAKLRVEADQDRTLIGGAGR
ncbi:MAG TPA: sigma-70 family RNA polymerase sigma factor, partial [Amycolatopsis sp.]|nr:sigma-70 family RNA polymerase sigma factor [Amycolatopsis sp.]